MWEFLQANASWILLGIFFVLMLRLHGGAGCGLGHGDDRRSRSAQRGSLTDDSAPDAATSERSRMSRTNPGGACHG